MHAGEGMCTVPRKNSAFRDSAHRGLQLLQEEKQKGTSTHSYTLFQQHSYIYTQQLNTSNCVFKVCIVVQLHTALAVYS